MDNIWFASALWVGLALFAAVLQNWVAVSIAVVYAVLIETGFNESEIGKIILAACFVTDLGTVLALGIVFANYNLWLVGFAVATVAVLLFLPRGAPWFFARMGRRVSEPQIK